MDNDQGLAIGAKGGKKGRNLRREQIDEDREVNPNPQPARPELPPYEAGTTITLTWTTTEGMIGDVIFQQGDTCVSVCSCQLVQAEYNRDREVVEHLKFSVKNLDDYIRQNTNLSAVRNFNCIIKYASSKGFLKESVSSRGNARLGKKVYAEFHETKIATEANVYSWIDQRPIAITLNSKLPAFRDIRDGIYKLPTPVNVDHAVLVVARGETRSGERFLVIQNSWGKTWGNSGYGRIQLNSQDIYQVFWVESVWD